MSPPPVCLKPSQANTPHPTHDAGAAKQLLSELASDSISTDTAQQYTEQQQHLQDGKVFGPQAPKVSPQSVVKAQIHALLHGHSNATPGFSHMLQTHAAVHSDTPQRDAGQQPAESVFESPLLRVLRRVSLQWYYRVMFDPLEQLVAISSSYELLFQLMTPHQQLSCMANILLVLACPVLQEQRWALLDVLCQSLQLCRLHALNTGVCL